MIVFCAMWDLRDSLAGTFCTVSQKVCSVVTFDVVILSWVTMTLAWQILEN